MNTAEIVIGKMKTYSSTKILQFPREGVRQSRESAKLHSDGQVLPLHETGGDVLGIGITGSDFGYNLRDRSWGVALISMLAIVSIELRKLREVCITRERFFDGLAVEDVCVGSQLDTMVSDPIPEVSHEGLRVSAGSFADQERGNQLRVRVQSNENPLITEVSGIVLADVSRLLHQERPDFIALDTTAGQLPHLAIHQSLGAFASKDQQPHDRVAIQASEPLCAADRASLKKAMQRTFCRIGIREERIAGEFCVGFGKAGIAGSVFPALNTALTEVTEAFAGLVLASNAGHVISPLAFCGETSQNRLSGSEAWAAPRFGLAPTSVSAEAGALIVKSYRLGWWFDRDFHDVTGSKCDLDSNHAVSILPESPVAAGLSHLTPKSFLIPTGYPVAETRATAQLLQGMVSGERRGQRFCRSVIAKHPHSEKIGIRIDRRPLGQFKHAPIGRLAVFGRPSFNFFIAQHSLKCRMAGRQRATLCVGTILKLVSHLNRCHFFRGHAEQERTDCIRQARSCVVSHRQKLSDLSLFVRRHLHKSIKDANCFPQTSNISVPEITLLNFLVQIRKCFVESFAVFVGSHKL
jgi:hypothetical protein